MSRRRARAIRERVITVAIIITIVIMFCLCSYIEHTYTREATVWVNKDGTTTFIDSCGYEWEADVDNVVHGQKVILIMDDHCSNSYIKDDVIKDVKPVKISME